jgi:hypothetical protein
LTPLFCNCFQGLRERAGFARTFLEQDGPYPNSFKMYAMYADNKQKALVHSKVENLQADLCSGAKDVCADGEVR